MSILARSIAPSVLALGLGLVLSCSCSRTQDRNFETEIRVACEARCDKELECNPNDIFGWVPDESSLVLRSISECVENCTTGDILNAPGKCADMTMVHLHCAGELSCTDYMDWMLQTVDEETGRHFEFPCRDTWSDMTSACYP